MEEQTGNLSDPPPKESESLATERSAENRKPENFNQRKIRNQPAQVIPPATGRRTRSQGVSGPLVPNWYVNTYRVGLCLILGVLVLPFLFAATRRMTATSATGVLLYVGVGITLLCVILWVGHLTRAIDLGPRVFAGIFSTLVLSILATSVGVYKSSFDQVNPIQLQVKLLNETNVSGSEGTFYLMKYEEKTNHDYILTPNTCPNYPGQGNQDVTIAFVAVISNFQSKDDGTIDVKATVLFSVADEGVTDVGQVDKFTRDDEWRSRKAIQGIPIADIEKVTGAASGKVVTTNILRCFHSSVLGPGNKRITVMVEDGIGHTFAKQTLNLTLRENRPSPSVLAQ